MEEFPLSVNTKINKTGIAAYGRYFKFFLKLTALAKGTGCKFFAFCSMEANNNSDSWEDFDN